MIQNVIFDAGNVLIQFDPNAMVENFDLTEVEKKILKQEVFRGVEWIKLDRGSVTVEEAEAAIKGRLPKKLQPFVDLLVNGWWDRNLVPIAGMAELLQELKAKHYGVYLLSNAPTTMRIYLNRIPGIECMDGIYITAEHKLMKPSHEVYEDFLQEFSLHAEECFFVDDNAANIEGAEEKGIQGTVFYGDVERLKQEMQQAGILL